MHDKYLWLIYPFIFKRNLVHSAWMAVRAIGKWGVFPTVVINAKCWSKQPLVLIFAKKNHWYQKVLFSFTKVDVCYLKTWCWTCVKLHCEIILKTPGWVEEWRWLKYKMFTRTGKENNLQKTPQQRQCCLCNLGETRPLGRSLCRGWYPKSSGYSDCGITVLSIYFGSPCFWIT